MIDEVQRMLSLFPLLRSLIDQKPEGGRFILFGSASPQLLAQSSETLAGRIVYRELTSIRWDEAQKVGISLSDLQLLGLKALPPVLQKLLRMLTTVQGSSLNYSNLGNSMGLSGNTIQGYIDYLEHSFVVRRLGSYFVNIGKRLVKSPKLYFRDSGILHYLTNISEYDELIRHAVAGPSWEGYVNDKNIERYFYHYTFLE